MLLLAGVVYCSEKGNLANDEPSHGGEKGEHKYAVFTGSRNHQETAQQSLEWQRQYANYQDPSKHYWSLVTQTWVQAGKSRSMKWKGESIEEKKGSTRTNWISTSYYEEWNKYGKIKDITLSHLFWTLRYCVIIEALFFLGWRLNSLLIHARQVLCMEQPHQIFYSFSLVCAYHMKF